MLAIRMQRTGRKGHAMFRMVVQDARRTPTSGKVVARLGSYDPHAKTIAIDKEKANFYLEHGAQPSDRVAYLLQQEGVKLPAWVKLSAEKQRSVRNADKRRSTRPAEPEAAEPAAKAEETPPAAETTEETAAAPATAEAASDEPAATDTSEADGAEAAEEAPASEEPAPEAADESEEAAKK